MDFCGSSNKFTSQSWINFVNHGFFISENFNKLSMNVAYFIESINLKYNVLVN